MKIRNGILNSGRAALLGGTFLLATLPTTLVFAQDTSGNSAMAADVAMPTKAPNINAADWYWNGIFEAGGNIFIEKPPNGFGRIPTDPFWLTPKTTDSNAKMDEYGKVPRGPFLDVFGINAGTKDGRFAVDFWADNVGYNNQRYQLEVYEPGRQYFNIGWDQIPHLLSSSAKTLFGGVGSTRLTVDTATRNYLQGQLATNAAFNPGPVARTNIDRFIGGAPGFGGAGFPAPMYNINLETLRERFIVGYRNTMLDGWDFNVDYSHEHRTGTRPLGIGYGISNAINPRPASGSIEVPQPLDDRTQNANASGEYAGTTPWGTRWNTALKYSGSFYSNENKSIDVDNPFCRTCSATGPSPFGASLLRYGLYPDNNVNGATWNTSVELPFFKTRYTSNVQYMAFRQNDTFINDATNNLTFGLGAGQIRPYPAASLNGEVNAFLTNNVLYSRLTSDLTNTARVRYYDRRDNTPTLTFLNYAYADSGLSSTVHTRDPHSYSRLNLEDDLKWQANRMWTFGLGYFFERYTYENGEVDATNESGAKAYINMTPWSWLIGRASVQYSQRRYDQWLGCTTNNAQCAMRQFFVQNRDQTKAYMNVEVQLTKDLTVAPNGGLRWIEYPTDAVWNGSGGGGTPPQLTNSLGTQYDRGWNAGADLSVRITPELRATAGYNYEEHYLNMQSCCGANIPFNNSNTWSSQIVQRYNTVVASALWNAIPGKLDILGDYIYAFGTEANNTIRCASGNSGCTGANSSGPTPIWPTEQNKLQRFNVVAKYYVDPSVVKQMGFVGNITLKARYTWEQNKADNWAINDFTPYSPSAADAGGADITNGGRSLFLAYNNPNYTAQILAFSMVGQW